MRWYSFALPMWTQEQQRILDPPSEAAEGEGTASFIRDASIADSEIDAVYETMPRRAG